MKLDVPLSEGIPYYCVLTQAKLRWRADAVSRRYPIPITAISISAIYLGEFIIRWADEDTYYDGGGFDGKRHVGSFSLIGAIVRRVEATVLSGPKIELSAGEGAPPPSAIDMRRIHRACACRRLTNPCPCLAAGRERKGRSHVTFVFEKGADRACDDWAAAFGLRRAPPSLPCQFISSMRIAFLTPPHRPLSISCPTLSCLVTVVRDTVLSGAARSNVRETSATPPRAPRRPSHAGSPRRFSRRSRQCSDRERHRQRCTDEYAARGCD